MIASIHPDLRFPANTMPNIPNIAKVMPLELPKGNVAGRSAATPAAVVVTVTVTGVLAVPGVTLAGNAEQVALLGAPVHDIAIELAYVLPAAGATVRL